VSIAPTPLLRDAVPDSMLEALEGHSRLKHYMRRGWLVRRMLLAADVIGLMLAFVFAEAAFAPASVDRIQPDVELLLFLVTLPAWVIVAKLYGLYDRDEERADHSTVDEVVDVLHVVTVGAWLLFILATLTGVADPNLLRLAAFWAFAVVGITTGRVVARSMCRRRMPYIQNTLIVGAGDIGQTIAEKLLRHPEYGLNLVGFVDENPKHIREEVSHVAVLGGTDRLEQMIELFDIERVVIAFSNESDDETLELIRRMQHLQVQIAIVPRLFELVGPNVGIHTVEGVPMLGLPPLDLSRSSRVLKRATDVLIAGGALLLLSPVFLAIAVAVKRGSPGPVFFHQVRIGTGGRPFRLLKFRTMVEDADERKEEFAHLNLHLARDPRMFKIANDPRVTRSGRYLRRYFLDELPQLVNVLRGEMSLIGPRPLIPQEARFVGAWGNRRLDLKPGMTGLWQVLGRSAMPFDEMVKLDYLYVTTWSLGNDLKLLVRTLPLVARGESAV
jgi:exopolysaccharide biosynthesis polyprenyl glycosylphosphotransferase